MRLLVELTVKVERVFASKHRLKQFERVDVMGVCVVMVGVAMKALEAATGLCSLAREGRTEMECMES